MSLQQTGRADPAAREISSLSRLEANLHCRHPNLLHIYHVGKTAGYLFYVMDPADDASGGPASDRPDYRPATLQSRLESAAKGDSPIFADTKIAGSPRGENWDSPRGENWTSPLFARGVLGLRPATPGRVGGVARGGHGPSRRETGQLPVCRRAVETGRFRTPDRGPSAGFSAGHAKIHAAGRPHGHAGRRVCRGSGDL